MHRPALFILMQNTVVCIRPQTVFISNISKPAGILRPTPVSWSPKRPASPFVHRTSMESFHPCWRGPAAARHLSCPGPLMELRWAEIQIGGRLPRPQRRFDSREERERQGDGTGNQEGVRERDIEGRA